MPENATVRSRATPSAEMLRVFIAMVELRPRKRSAASMIILARRREPVKPKIYHWLIAACSTIGEGSARWHRIGSEAISADGTCHTERQ